MPDGVGFVLDDITDPSLAVYTGAGAIYALDLPPELHHAVWKVARRVEADLLFTTLGGDGPEIPVSRRTIPGDTVFVAER